MRNVHHISILAVKRPDGEMCMMPDANYVILADDHLMVIGMNTDIQKLLDRIK